jgi:porphobilinogen synthase
VLPLFVAHGRGVEREIPSLPGHAQLSVDEVLDRRIDALREAGVPAVLLFGLPASKDELGSEAYDPDGIVQRAVRRIKSHRPDTLVITDVCCCEYTSHGHCGVLRQGTLDPDATLAVIDRIAVTHAEAGADIVAPSGMIDGAVGAIRRALDADGFSDRAILGYSVKYASAFYGPFRDAAGSAPQSGDRRHHQMDPANVREALREAELDEAEGADMLMVKPALGYLDVLRAIRERTRLPLAAYSVSGEYAMMKAAVERGWLDERRAVLESLLGIRRAGADVIITYYAEQAARWLREGVA